VYLIGQGALSDGVGVIWPEDGKEWLLAGCLALFPTLLGHTPLNAALRHFPASVVSTAFLGEVAVAPLLVWLYPGLGETPPAAFWSGGPLVVLGIATVAWRGTLEKSNISD
jgi:drug/metabolite transporter (DMT)-like permease